MTVSKNKKIVICDDDQDSALATSAMLTAEGYQVDVVDGHDALEALVKRYVPDLLILDIEMPDMNGFEILEELHETGVRVPVFMLTGHDNFLFRRYSPVAGAIEFITKPIDNAILIDKIQSTLAGSETSGSR